MQNTATDIKHQDADASSSHIEFWPTGGQADCRPSGLRVMQVQVSFGNEILSLLRRLVETFEHRVEETSSPVESLPLPPVGSISSLTTSPFLDAKQAAMYLGTTVSSLYGLVERKQIEPMRGPRRRYRFTKEMLDEYLKRGKRR